MSEQHEPVDPQAAVLNGLIAKAIENGTAVRAEACRRSFFTFVQEFWDELVPDPLQLNWHMAVLCSELQQLAEGVARGDDAPYDLIENVPPGTTKSTLSVIMFPAWCWTRWLWMRFICGSYSGPLAGDHGGLCKDLVQSEKYKAYFPKVRIRSDHDARSNFRLQDVKEINEETGQRYTIKGGQRIACSVGGTVTGRHAHIILMDDPLNPKQAVSKTQAQTACEFMDQTLSTRKVDKAKTPTVLIMQRLHENDPTGNWLSQEKEGKRIKHICLPIECVNYEVKPAELKAFYTADGLLDPKRMPWTVIADMKISLGQYGFAGQCGQNPAPPSGGMFDVEKLMQNTVDVPPSKVVRTVRYWDKAGTDKKENPGAAHTAGLQMGLMENGEVIILHVERGQWSADKRERRMRSIAEADGHATRIYVEQEPGSGGKDSARMSIKNLHGYSCRADPPRGDKIYRADPLSAATEAGHVFLLRGEWNRAFIDEARLFPNSTYKDQIDAGSGAYMKLVGGKHRAGALRGSKKKEKLRRARMGIVS